MRTRFAPVGDPHDPIARCLPMMKTWAEMREQVGHRLWSVADEQARRTVVAVNSGGPVGATFDAFANASHKQGIALAHETLSTSITEWHQVGRNWKLISHSDASHLDAS